MNHNMRFGFSFNETNYLPRDCLDLVLRPIVMGECPVSCALIGQGPECCPLIGPLSACHMCDEGIVSVISVTAVHQIQTQL